MHSICILLLTACAATSATTTIYTTKETHTHTVPAGQIQVTIDSQNNGGNWIGGTQTTINSQQQQLLQLQLEAERQRQLQLESQKQNPQQSQFELHLQKQNQNSKLTGGGSGDGNFLSENPGKDEDGGNCIKLHGRCNAVAAVNVFAKGQCCKPYHCELSLFEGILWPTFACTNIATKLGMAGQ